MKRLSVATLVVAVSLYATAAFAQHGHMGGGVGSGSMGAGMGHNTGSHNTTMSHPSGTSASLAHGRTLDQLLTQNTKLSGKIESLTGLPAQQACDGFKNLGQCVAAAHVSKNLDINFACMKADMTGTAVPSGTTCPDGTGAKSSSLGKAIQILKPSADSKNEAKKGTQQASQDLEGSNNS